MIFSGADLIRNSGRQAERAERIVAPIRGVQAPAEKKPTQEETGGALLRFARFVHDEAEKKKKKALEKPAPKRHGLHPYAAAFKALESEEGKGSTLDISI